MAARRANSARVSRNVLGTDSTLPTCRPALATHPPESASALRPAPELPTRSDVRTTRIDPPGFDRDSRDAQNPADFDGKHSE